VFLSKTGTPSNDPFLNRYKFLKTARGRLMKAKGAYPGCRRKSFDLSREEQALPAGVYKEDQRRKGEQSRSTGRKE